MVLKKVGVVGTASAADVLSGETFTSETEGGEATGSMPNNGSGSIDGPNDTMSGSGYYSSVLNNIPDRGVGDIDGPNDELSGAGYYSRIDNNIPDRGNENVTAGGNDLSLPSGYYSSINVSSTPLPSSTYNDLQNVATDFAELQVVGTGITNPNAYSERGNDSNGAEVDGDGHLRADPGYEDNASIVSDKIDMTPIKEIKARWRWRLEEDDGGYGYTVKFGIVQNIGDLDGSWPSMDYAYSHGQNDVGRNANGLEWATLDVSNAEGEYHFGPAGTGYHRALSEVQEAYFILK